MKKIEEILSKLSPADKAWLSIGPQKYNWSVDDVCKKVREKTGEDVDPTSVAEYLQSKGLSPVRTSADSEVEVRLPASSGQFSSAMERDIELALVTQLDTLGLRLFVDEAGRDGQQYPAGEFGRIDLLTTDLHGDLVVVELKREDTPRDTIGQVAGYIAFVRKNLAQPKGQKVVGWILARPSSPRDDRILEEAAEAVGIFVKWYWVRVELLDGRVSGQ
jgi:hypothetical protein